ncbi:MAG: CheR family methyltransferase [Cyanobacteria bacterium J06607_10]
MQHDETIRHEIESLLRQKIGLNPNSIGSRSILRAVRKGMRTGRMDGLSDYLAALKASPEQFESLVESIVVPETSFFRNRASFVYLRQWVAQTWQRKRPLRVLSLPCSTGEEPYSIAITLLEEGLSMDEFHIDAVDISTRALEKARQGIYSPYAFRRQTYRSDDKYFTLDIPEGTTPGKRVTQRYYLIESVRDKVAFLQGNVLDPQLLADAMPYDIIFCRNLLIYFDRVARETTLEKITRLLDPEGVLFLGYAETNLVDDKSYQPVPYPQTFAYRRQPATAASSTITPQRTVHIAPAEFAARPAVPSTSSNHPPASVSGQLSDRKVMTDEMADEIADEMADEPSLQLAQRLADSGDLAAATAQCDRYLASQPSDAAAHLLRGELYQADNNMAAAQTCFEKSIYLDPQLEPALTHLMFLKEENQDYSGAAILRDRLQRLSS